MFLRRARSDVEDRTDERYGWAGLVCLEESVRLGLIACEVAVSFRVAIACELTPTVETGYAPAGA